MIINTAKPVTPHCLGDLGHSLAYVKIENRVLPDLELDLPLCQGKGSKLILLPTAEDSFPPFLTRKPEIAEASSTQAVNPV